MIGPFQGAQGSIIGRDHLALGKNNQDAWYWLENEQALIAIVCDGCGSGAHSEVGAQLGARLLAQTIATTLQTPSSPEDQVFWSQVQQDFLRQLSSIVTGLGDSRSQVVREYFLFTIVGTVITPDQVWLFSCGDGAILVNGQMIQLGPFPDNAPPYLAYNLLGGDREGQSSDGEFRPNPALQFHAVPPIEQIESLVLGTDGLGELISVAAKPLPGKTELVGDISQFWQQDRYFANPDMIRRRLALINRESTQLNRSTYQVEKQVGLLPDDTTLMVIRRSRV